MANGSSISTTSKSLQELYESKSYEQFIDQLSKERENLGEGIYHYNLGTAYLKMGRHPESRYHLEKALEEGLFHSGIRKNLNTVVKNLELGTMEEGGHISDQVLNYATRLSPDFSLCFGLILAIVFMGLFRFKKIKKTSFILALIVSLCPILFSFSIHRMYRRAIVLEASSVYEGPSKSFEISSEIPPGMSVIIRADGKDWFYVESPGHFSGWIDRKRIGIL
ncbi:MAG: hypothetical protein OXB88_00660 [Bacteriovoracales bacterium]|nr:hypothetical protein [Bacteriovoracales bacterium]